MLGSDIVMLRYLMIWLCYDSMMLRFCSVLMLWFFHTVMLWVC